MRKIIKIIGRPILHFFEFFLTNYIISFIPIVSFRKLWYKYVMQMKIGQKTYIDMSQYFIKPWKIQIGNNTHINRGCFLDGRGGLKIGNSVSVSHKVSFVTGSHDLNSENMDNKFLPINVDDYVFIGYGSTILGNVTIGYGAIICAGSVVTKNVESFAIYAGIPARKIGIRKLKDLNYKCNPRTFFC